VKALRPLRVLLVLCALALIVIVSFVVQKWPPSATLSDGTVIRLEAVTYGKSHTLRIGAVKPLEWLREHLPFMAGFLPAAKGVTSKTSTSNDGLVFWLTHFDPKTGQHFDNLSVAAVDEHGCKFLENSSGGASSGKLYLRNSAFEAFPRRESSFRMNVRAGDRQTSFEIKSPAHGPFPKWTPEELPATRSDGDLAITLNSLQYHSDPYASISGDFAVRRSGVLTKEWKNQSMRLMDATGNAAWNVLCTNEPAWKITAKFYRVASASFDESEIWRLPKVRAPGDGEGITLDRSNSIGGVQIRVLAFAGAGTHTISNGVFLSSSADAIGEQWNINRLSSKNGFYIRGTISHAAPALVLETKGLAGDDRLLVRAKDAMGRIIIADQHASLYGVSGWGFHPSAAAEEVELELLLNRPRYAEFIVKPPIAEPVK